ncbi:hypothetical protein Poli38472_004497 [Pythium oligandrum]|uniref:Uncharacterized protein n=1 Tax=Pythium oligandrum TaxID=41045 RepID=A0A8K1FI66_PYTOL|nr:hypothetical protein Poli38472_004497 [Pythium oligandrum]|eukprot:TMW59428.1 hypothetical protein Poli38472_004497 [Pythium oligandrum]
MGNAPSDAAEDDAITRVSRLKEELADMERAIQVLRQSPEKDPLLPHQVRVHDAIVDSDPHVHVVVGPVIGKVEPQRARVLLEVDRDAKVTCHVLLYDERVARMVPLPQCETQMDCVAQRPAVFVLCGLLPGRFYRVVFSGVHHEDVIAHTGSFRTPTLAQTTLQCVVVSADDPHDLEYGERSLWKALRRRVDDRDVHIVLHLGGQVMLRRMFDKAWTLLMRHAECTRPPAVREASNNAFGSAWGTLEAQAMDTLRSAYHTQWTLVHDKQHVLAHASNLMMWSDWEVYPSFTTSPLFRVDHTQPTIEMQVLRTVTRCARRLYHEYQRALWDDELDDLVTREKGLHELAETALATTARIHQLGLQIPAAQADLERQKERRDIEGARRVERHLRGLENEKAKTENQLVSYNQLLAPQRGEEFLFCIGGLGFLFLDLRSARMEPGGSQCADNLMLSTLQWEFIERTLERDDLKVLVLCSEVPVVDALPQELRNTDTSSAKSDYKTWWGSSPVAQQRLLGLLFEWKLERSDRQVVLLAGSCNTRFAMQTQVRDTRLRTEVMQFMVGPITASSIHDPQSLSSRPSTLFDRYEYEHQNVEMHEKAFASVTFGMSPTCSQGACDWTLVHGSSAQNPAIVILGPVVGYVDAASAVIMLEVDRESDLVCVLENPLTGEKHRIFEHFESHRPQSFYVAHLRSEHHYQVSFERIQQPERYCGSFQTLAKQPTKFDVVALTVEHSIDVVESQQAQPSRLWPSLTENLGHVPFRGVDLLVLFERDKRSEDYALISQAADEEQMIEHLRQSQRLKWNMPELQHILAYGGGAHIVLSRNAWVTDAKADPRYTRLQACMDRVELEYANCLLPPSKRVTNVEERARRPISTCIGAFGVFILPNMYERLDWDRGCAVLEEVWTRLKEFLYTPLLNTVMLITPEPVVEDSFEDIEEKARFQDVYRRKLGFYRRDFVCLLQILMEWQEQAQGATTATTKRHVLMLSGHEWRSFDSVIQQAALLSNPSDDQLQTPLLLQYAVGPLDAPSLGDMSLRLDGNVFPQGTLTESLVYFHRFHRRAKQVPTENSADDGAGTFLHIQFALTPSIDDSQALEIVPLYVVSCEIEYPPQSESAITASQHSAVPQVQWKTVRADTPADLTWRLEVTQPQWLVKLVSDPLTEAEETQIREIEEQLFDKTDEIKTSFNHNEGLSSGLVTMDHTSEILEAVHDAITYYYRQLSGPVFRAKCPSVPSRYVLSYTWHELIAGRAADQEESHEGSILVGAMEATLYRDLVGKSFVNAWLFRTRLETYWS